MNPKSNKTNFILEPNVSHGKPKKFFQSKSSETDTTTTFKAGDKPRKAKLSPEHLEQPFWDP